MKRRLNKLYNRIWYCLFGEHRDQGFTSYPLPGGNLRVSRCLHCRVIVDVIFLADISEVGLELKLGHITVGATPGITAPEPVSLKKYLEK